MSLELDQRQRAHRERRPDRGAKSISGDVEIIETQTDGALDASTRQRQRHAAQGVSARGIDLGTVSGDVDRQDVAVRPGRRSTRSAATSTSAARSRRTAATTLKSHSGDVRVALAGTPASSSKPTRSAARSAPTSRSPIDGRRPADRARRRSLQGVYGDGSAVLDRHHVLGHVVISRSDAGVQPYGSSCFGSHGAGTRATVLQPPADRSGDSRQSLAGLSRSDADVASRLPRYTCRSGS